MLKDDVFDPVIYEMLQKQMQCQHVNLTSRGSNGWQVRNSCLDCHKVVNIEMTQQGQLLRLKKRNLAPAARAG